MKVLEAIKERLPAGGICGNEVTHHIKTSLRWGVSDNRM